MTQTSGDPISPDEGRGEVTVTFRFIGCDPKSIATWAAYVCIFVNNQFKRRGQVSKVQVVENAQ